MLIFFKLLQITTLMGNKIFCKRKFDHTQDKTHHNEQRKEHDWRNKRGCAHIVKINDNDVNRCFQQQEVQPDMHAHIVYIKSIEFKFKLLFNIIDCNLNLIFFKKTKIDFPHNVDEVISTEIEVQVELPTGMYITLDNTIC